MKIRSGFVSNSSSSSFCIYGTYLEFSEIIEKLKASNLLTKDESRKFDEDEDADEDEYMYENLEELLSEKTDLSLYFDYEGDSAWIDWSSIGDDETGRQFKEDVESELIKVFGTDVDFGTHDETIYN